MKIVGFIDREEVVSSLMESVLDENTNTNFALIGPRQIGKTSILREFAERIGEKVIVVSLDFSVYRYSPEDFSRFLIQSLTAVYAERVGGAKKMLTRISNIFQGLKELKRLRLSFTFEVDEQGKPQVSLRPELKEREIDAKELVELPFAYASRIAEEARTRVVVVLDEFQHFAEFSSYPGLKEILDILRHVLDERGNVCYIVSGSRIHFLSQILGDGKSPLFGRFSIIEVGELNEKFACELYVNAQRGASPEEAQAAYRLVGGHPFYLLALAENKKSGESPKDTYDRLLSTPTGAFNLYARYIIAEDLGSHAKAKQSRFLKILYALASNASPVSELSKQTGIALTSLPWYIQQLKSYDLIVKGKDGYSIKERVLKDYLARNSLRYI